VWYCVVPGNLHERSSCVVQRVGLQNRASEGINRITLHQIMLFPCQQMQMPTCFC
jgi:hypothetical protein